MSRGIVLIACGHPYYGRMAAALAATIKCEFNMPITLASAGGAEGYISQGEHRLFDNHIALEERYFTNSSGVKSWLRPKLFLPEFTPYEETLYLDCDIAWLSKSPNDLFNQCHAHQFVIKNYGSTNIDETQDDVKEWANTSDIRALYGLKDTPIYHLSSEAIYFRKTPEVVSLFRAAAIVYDGPRIPYREFAGGVADELALSIACMQNKLHTGIDKWNPIFWRQMEKRQPVLKQIREQFYGLSMGGSRSGSQEKQIYNVLVAAAYQRLNIQNPYKWIDKARFLNERKKY